MPANRNTYIEQLLSWHGQSQGGVHVPFQQQANPLGQTIETTIVAKLRKLARDIAQSSGVARWIFLVGGPGNGKSETVQDFLTTLDTELSLGGALRAVLSAKFSPNPLLPRRVEVSPSDLATGQQLFAAKVGRLIVVQDATATETAAGNAASELAADVKGLLTGINQPMPVFIVCANRGLLARAMNDAYNTFGEADELTQVFAKLIRASSITQEAQRSSCWPLSDQRFACWPLDVESLLIPASTQSPFSQIISHAVDSPKWEVTGKCFDCVSRNLCPFRQNAEWLRDPTTRQNLTTVLRRGELARGRRWNFRDAFSLIAELMVGQWSDFEGELSPCDWVHRKAPTITVSPNGAAPAVAFVQHLFPHALFGSGILTTLNQQFQQRATIDPATQPFSAQVEHALRQRIENSSKPIRELLARDYSRLDPAIYTPPTATHIIRRVEDAFSQSVELGIATIQVGGLSLSESVLLSILHEAELEWDILARDYINAIHAVCLLRHMAAIWCKRSVGIKGGLHALEEFVTDYEQSLRDPTRLGLIRGALQQLLGEGDFRFNLVESYGQPQGEIQPIISLESVRPGIRAYPAPPASESAPGHDMPYFQILGTETRMPLTFDFYLALRLRSQGCAGSSLPASVRAALDRVRHKYAGTLCRNDEEFVNGRATITLIGSTSITLQEPGGVPEVTTT